MNRPLIAALTAFFLAFGLAEARADLVILNNGNVFIGKIREDEVTDTHITLRWPYRLQQSRMEWKFLRGTDSDNVRYFWRNPDPNKHQDVPPNEYWEKYSDVEKYPIADKYLPLLAKWKEARRSGLDAGDLFVRPGDAGLGGRSLSAVPFRNRDPLFTIRFPNQWRAAYDYKRQVAVSLSSKLGSGGFRSRIAVFAIRRVIDRGPEKQINNLLEELGRFGKFEILERGRLRAEGRDRFTILLTTRTTHQGQAITVLRRVVFRPRYTYFFFAYADERDFGGLKMLFKASAKSLWVGEDDRKTKKSE